MNETLRCDVTNNPCGSDTRPLGHPCQCEPCQVYHRWADVQMEGRQVFELVKTFFGGNRDLTAQWMRMPNPFFGGMTAVEFIKTKPGRAVKLIERALEESAR